MKICKNCGTSNFDIEIICKKCKCNMDEKSSVRSSGYHHDTSYVPSIDREKKQSFSNSNIHNVKQVKPIAVKENGLSIAAKVLMILSIWSNAMAFIMSAFLVAFNSMLICLVPMFIYCGRALTGLFMTLHYFKKVSACESVGLGFKICTLLFVNPISGSFMLCMKEPSTKIISQFPIQEDLEGKINQYKELLEKGFITREEFEAKKKQILGL